MKNLWGVLKGLLIVVIFQLTLISCTDSEIIKSQGDETQLEQDYQKTNPANGGGKDDDDEEGDN